MNNVISLTTRKPITGPAKSSSKAAPAPAQRPFSRTDDLEPHLLEPGKERDYAVYVALVLAMDAIKPPSFLPRRPLEALRKTRRALAILEIECVELAKNGGAA